MTSSPGLKFWTPGPASATTPLGSWPAMKGNFTLRRIPLIAL